MSALDSQPPKFYCYSFKISWYDQNEVFKILHKNVVIFKNTIYIINIRDFPVLFVQGTFSTKPVVNFGIDIVALITTTNIKVCVFRGLSRDLIKA